MAQNSISTAGADTGSLKSYTTGFLLSVVLTAAAFGLVMMRQDLARGMVLIGILIAAVVQIWVHLRYFLHMNASSSSRWNLIAMIFTVLIMALFVGGTLWIMADLNFRMM